MHTAYFMDSKHVAPSLEDAMQWCGFIFFGFVVALFVHRDLGRNKALTIDEARRRLDEIEAEEDAGGRR